MTTQAEWMSVPGVKDLSSLYGPYSIQPTSPRAIEQLFVNLLRDAVTAENALNNTRANKSNFFASSINEKGEYTGSVKVPVTLGNITVA